MNELDIDVHDLIDLIRDRPVIWDRSCDTYKDKLATKAAWKEIYTIVKPDYENLAESKQTEIGNLITNRWTNMRDNWMKSHKKYLNQIAAGQKPGKKYVFYDKLNFLTKIVDPNNDSLKMQYKLRSQKENSMSSPDDTYHDATTKYLEIDEESTVTDLRDSLRGGGCSENSGLPVALQSNRHEELLQCKISKRSSADLCTSNFVQVVETPEFVNYDQSFFDSLLPFIVHFDEDQKLEFRTEVLNLVRRIKRQKRDE